MGAAQQAVYLDFVSVLAPVWLFTHLGYTLWLGIWLMSRGAGRLGGLKRS